MSEKRVADLKASVDGVLFGFLADERHALAREHTGAEEMVEEIERLARAGGKRVRPVLCVLGHLAAGGDAGDPILKAGAALELLHTFAIVHDDLMDGSLERRGVEATHMKLGTAGAVLVGDMAQVLADHLLLASGFGPDRLVPALRAYTAMRLSVAVGQHLDLATGPDAGEAVARRIAMLKTGSYTVEGPLRIGAVLAGARPDVLGALREFGRPLGEAFQVRDDLEGVLGEGLAHDLERSSPNTVVALAFRLAGPTDAAFLRGLPGRDGLDRAELTRARELLESSGAVQEARKSVAQLVDRAVASLERAPLAASALSGLSEVARMIGEVGP